LNLRSDDLQSVSKLYPKDHFRQLVVTAPDRNCIGRQNKKTQQQEVGHAFRPSDPRREAQAELAHDARWRPNNLTTPLCRPFSPTGRWQHRMRASTRRAAISTPRSARRRIRPRYDRGQGGKRRSRKSSCRRPFRRTPRRAVCRTSATGSWLQTAAVSFSSESGQNCELRLARQISENRNAHPGAAGPPFSAKCGVRRCAEKATQDSGSKYSAQT
jgi:hypothetical protein